MTVPAAAVVLLAGGCSDGGGPETSAATLAGGQPTVAPESDGSGPRADEALAALAKRGAAANFTARYSLDSSEGPDATVQVFKRGSRYRVDITQDGITAQLIRTAKGLVSCQRRGVAADCFLVAAPGEQLPALLDPGLQRIFTTGLELLAADHESVQVRRAEPLPSSTGPAASCFAVSGEGIDDGEYCLLDSGIPARASFAAATLELLGTGEPPPADAFVPPAKPTPLPD